MTSVVVMMISAMTKKRTSVLVLEWPNRSRVMVLVFVNWKLYKKNLSGIPQRVRGFSPGREPTSCVLVSFVLVNV